MMDRSRNNKIQQLSAGSSDNGSSVGEGSYYQSFVIPATIYENTNNENLKAELKKSYTKLVRQNKKGGDPGNKNQ